jgi:GTP-binding protein
MSKPFTLAIVGRPNVGKSTLFNRIAGKKMAIVNDQPGITRDWREAEGMLMGRPLRIIDTAGLEESFDDSIQGRMRRQTEAALKEADAVLFMIDGRAGLVPMDEHFALWLRKQGVPVIMGINKCENEKAAAAAIAESYGLGFGDPVVLSAEHGIGMDMLYDALQPHMPPEQDMEIEDEKKEENILPHAIDDIEGDENYDFAAQPEEEEKSLKIAIVGRPNVGKSTLLNSIVGSERVMTGPEAGITRDAIAVHWEYEGRAFRLVDTAGLRKHAKVVDTVERMAGDDTMRAIRLAHVCVLVIDAIVMLEKQDLTIAHHIAEEGRALVIAVNKWDLIQDTKEAMEKLNDRLAMSLAQLKDVPVITLSAQTGRNVNKVLDAVLRAYETWNARVPTGKLNRWLAGMESRNPAPLVDGRANRLKYITQIKSRPPTFVLWVSQSSEMPDIYTRYIVNGLRYDFKMPGVPIRLLVRSSKNPYT